ncbi:MAG: glycerate kinase [Microbacteriaceae bacterium]|nr:glycerate kinase [Microbacteriaceae bacterium]
MRVLIAPDSLKGTIDAPDAAEAIARGWRSVRPGDDLVLLPQADGGEGTIAVMAASVPGARIVDAGVATGPDGAPRPAWYLALPDGTAVVELAVTSGLPLMAEPDPMGATTRGLGEVMARALADGARSIVVGLGGSASTDGGAGALEALGLSLRDADGAAVPPGGAGLLRVATADRSGLLPPPPGGVRLLCDVTAPLIGPGGAAAVFGPQKGASPAQIAELEHGLERFAGALGASAADTAAPGTGAAGGTAFGLAQAWGAEVVPGARTIAELTGLTAALSGADAVVTGEGRFDATSLGGKVVGEVLSAARTAGVIAGVIAGEVAIDAGVAAASLVELAGSRDAARGEPARWLEAAGARLSGEMS